MKLPSTLTKKNSCATPRRDFLKWSAGTVASSALLYSHALRVAAHEVIMPVCGCESGQQSVLTMPEPVDNIIDWDDGRRINLSAGETATCSSLKPGQLYCLFLYNNSKTDQNVDVTLVWSNSNPPVTTTVPGTKDNQGPASLVMVSGRDTSTVSAAVTEASGGSIECYIGSVDMPTNTQGIHNFVLHPDGKSFPLIKDFRYYTVPEDTWYEFTIENKYNQSSVIGFHQNTIAIYIVNPTTQAHAMVTTLGSVKEGQDYQVILPATGSVPQRISERWQGNGSQWVWMNAGSEENSRSTAITLQVLNADISDSDTKGSS